MASDAEIETVPVLRDRWCRAKEHIKSCMADILPCRTSRLPRERSRQHGLNLKKEQPPHGTPA